MSTTNSDMDQKFEDAIAGDWMDDGNANYTVVATLASQVSIWRSRASYWHGRAEGMAETIDYLKQRIKTLEGMDNDDHSTFDDRGNRVEAVKPS